MGPFTLKTDYIRNVDNCSSHNRRTSQEVHNKTLHRSLTHSLTHILEQLTVLDDGDPVSLPLEPLLCGDRSTVWWRSDSH